MKPKVVWTTREWAIIAEWFRDNDIDPTQRGFANALREAQTNKLPSDRHRSIVGLTIKTRLDVALAINLLQAKPHAPVATPDPAPQVTKVEVLSTEELLVELARRIAKLLEPRSDAQSSVLEQLRFLEEKFASVDRGFYPPPKHDPSPVQEVKPPRKKVLVIGPNNDAEKFLHEEFPNLALRFVNKDDPPSRITDLARCCEVIVAVTKFCSHKQTETMKAQNKTPWALVTSTQELREWLRKCI